MQGGKLDSAKTKHPYMHAINLDREKGSTKRWHSSVFCKTSAEV